MADKYAKNEVMDRAHIICEMWRRVIMEQPAVRETPELKAQAELIAGDLADFYQACGRVAFGENSKDNQGA